MDSNSLKRLFIAVELDRDIRKDLYIMAKGLSDLNSNIRKIPEQNIHLTMKFLGDTRQGLIPNIVLATRDVAHKKKPFICSLSRELSAFPNLKKARVFVYRFLSGQERIIEVFKELESNLGSLCLKRDKRLFIPHISIARAKRPSDLRDDAQKFSLRQDTEVIISNLTVFESELKQSGAEYSIIQRFDLK